MTETMTTTTTEKPRTKKKVVKQDETDAQKFTRLAKFRMTGLLKRGDQVVTVMRYEHTPEQAKAIVDALFDLARRVQAASDKAKKHSDFNF